MHWTGVKLHGYLKEQLALELGYRTTVRWLHELNFHLRVPQPWPERQNQEERKQFLEELRALGEDPKVELWFSDECGVEGDPRPRRRWVQPGKRRPCPYLGDHIRQNVIGAVASQSGALFSLILDGVDTDVFQFFLDDMARAVPKKEGVRQILILDNASWGISLPIAPKLSPSDCVPPSRASSTIPPKLPPSALSGNDFRQSLLCGAGIGISRTFEYDIGDSPAPELGLDWHSHPSCV